MSRGERNPEIRPNPELPLFREYVGNARVSDLGELKREFNLEQAHARNSDPETSKAAARSVVNLGRTRDAILALLANHSNGLTDQQIWEEYWRHGGPNLASTSPSGLRSRRSELCKYGLVESCGIGKTASGRPCTIWKIKDGAAYAAGA